jgi:predicted transcriptional regulator/CRP-like cAMP-binding protein
MKTVSVEVSSEQAQKPTSLADEVKGWEEECRGCHPLSPTTCITSCRIWSLKNEFRHLHEKMADSTFMTRLLNTLKNSRRLEILRTISRREYSIDRLQQELKKLGYQHSQETIVGEYLIPLIQAGLAKETLNRYHATMFGCRLAELIRRFPDIGDVLPPHSECYEEITLRILRDEPKTYEDLEAVIPRKSVARVLHRLEKASLVETTQDKDYVFFFRTKRNPAKASFSPTETRIYDNISIDGISARKLAEKAMISLRRTYKYLRRLKGKKMVFTRERPKSYALTPRGIELALTIDDVHNVTREIQVAAMQVVG